VQYSFDSRFPIPDSRFPILVIYLDHAATTPLAPQVLEAMLPWLREGYANPASDHAPGRAARRAVEQARAQVAALLGAQPEEIVWTSGATESNNLAIKGALEFRGTRDAHLISSRIEHKSVLDSCRALEVQGVRVSLLKPDRDGRLLPEQVLAELTPQTVLVSLMWVNNEIGVINDIEALAPQLRERGVLLHVDATQAAGKLDIDLARTPVDLLSLSAHKLYGPKGIGALFVRKRPRARLSPQLHGGGHEQGMRSGTLATHQIVGFGAAAALASGTSLSRQQVHAEALAGRLRAGLESLPQIHLNGEAAPRLPQILNLSFEGVEGESLRAALPGLAVSSGSACSSATREPSYVLRALGRGDELAGASLRFSPGRDTSEAEVSAAAAQVVSAVCWLRALASGEPAESPLLGADNAYDYPDPVWRRFRDPSHRRPLGAGGEEHRAEASGAAGQGRLVLRAWLREGRVVDSAFEARGCPVTIAVGDWLAQWLRERLVADLGLELARLRGELEIPADKAHCALLGEDVLDALKQEMGLA
jgi:cysteine desulfurase